MRAWAQTAVAALAMAGGWAVADTASAHHSFAVYFDSSKDITLQGRVTAFRFTNPHGVIVLQVRDAQGQEREWRAETNAPAVLTRRGWTRDSVKVGEQITIEGWPSRDGKPYIRLRSATDAQGNLVGTAPFGRTDQT